MSGVRVAISATSIGPVRDNEVPCRPGSARPIRMASRREAEQLKLPGGGSADEVEPGGFGCRFRPGSAPDPVCVGGTEVDMQGVPHTPGQAEGGGPVKGSRSGRRRPCRRGRPPTPPPHRDRGGQRLRSSRDGLGPSSRPWVDTSWVTPVCARCTAAGHSSAVPARRGRRRGSQTFRPAEAAGRLRAPRRCGSSSPDDGAGRSRRLVCTWPTPRSSRRATGRCQQHFGQGDQPRVDRQQAQLTAGERKVRDADELVAGAGVANRIDVVVELIGGAARPARLVPAASPPRSGSRAELRSRHDAIVRRHRGGPRRTRLATCLPASKGIISRPMSRAERSDITSREQERPIG